MYLPLCPRHTANHHCRVKYFNLCSISSVVRTTANGILIIFQLTNASGSGCCCISRTTTGDVIKTWNTGWQRLWRYAYSVTEQQKVGVFHCTSRAFISTVFEQRLISRSTNSGNCACTLLSAGIYNCSTYSNWSDSNPPYAFHCESFFILIDSIIEEILIEDETFFLNIPGLDRVIGTIGKRMIIK